MQKTSLIKRILSYVFPVPVKKLSSQHSGDLFITVENGRLVLNTATVNYSYHSLHRVFKTAFHQSKLAPHLIQHSLLLGLGGGSIVEILRKDYEIQTPIDAVELDPQIIRIAINDFGISRYEPLQIIEKDAMDYVHHCSVQYDLICVDLFINDVVPSQFLTVDFFEKLLSLTRNQGSIYFNIMLANPQLIQAYNQLYQYLISRTEPAPVHVSVCEIEETNRVLVISK
jgi:spermidine synthase